MAISLGSIPWVPHDFDLIHFNPVDMLHDQDRLGCTGPMNLGDDQFMAFLEIAGEAFHVARFGQHVEFFENGSFKFAVPG